MMNLFDETKYLQVEEDDFTVGGTVVIAVIGIIGVAAVAYTATQE